jgi:Galactose oxidase, central domain
MKPNLKPLFLAILVLTSGLAGCNLRKQTSGSTPGSGSSPGTAPTTQTISGTVTGLTGTGMVLQDNGGDDLTIIANGTFTFKTAVSGAYAVTIKTQPSGPTQNCTVAFGSGTATANVTNVQINCGSGLTVGGTVSGLIGSGLVLQNNGTNNFQVTGTGNVPFTFSSPITAGTTYAVTILSQPTTPAQVCAVVNGTGTVKGNVTNVEVICTQPGFTIGGSVVGLVEGPGDTLELQNNAGDDLFVTGDTTFTFPTKVTNGGIYNVLTFLPPHSQPQPCDEFFYTGIATSDVSGVIIDCQHNDWAWISWYVPRTEAANNYASVTTPLFPLNSVPPPNVSTPGGRDFAASWTDNQGRRWLFGGNGFPYPSPLGKQLPNLLNDLWVFDGSAGGWVPANVRTVLPPGATNFIDDPTALELEFVATGASPGSRWGSSSWTDASGNLYLFGGQGYGSTPFQLDTVLLNDLWKCTPAAATVDINGAGTSSCPWVSVGGSTVGNTSGTYGTKGTPATGNIPGGRWAASTQQDSTATTVWLFGGQGVDSAGTTGLLNDLWKYSGGQWTWVSGSNVVNTNGVYGAQGTAAAGNAPGSRQNAVLWIDTSGNVWLFGGFGLDSVGTGGPAGAILNDLWEFNTTTNQWTWVSGSNLANQTGTYSKQASSNLFPALAGDVPGSRWGAVGWSDANSNLWLFGGWGYGTAATDPTGFMSDIWEYQQSTGHWIWWKGTANANQNTVIATKTIPFADALPFVKNIVGARRGAAIWQPDVNGYVWIFGGEGYDTSQGAPPGYLDDMWSYLPFPN